LRSVVGTRKASVQLYAGLPLAPQSSGTTVTTGHPAGPSPLRVPRQPAGSSLSAPRPRGAPKHGAVSCKRPRRGGRAGPGTGPMDGKLISGVSTARRPRVGRRSPSRSLRRFVLSGSAVASHTGPDRPGRTNYSVLRM